MLQNRKNFTRVFSTRELNNSTFTVYTGTSKPSGEKLPLYTQYGKYSGAKSEQRRTEIKRQFTPKKKEGWERMPAHLEQQHEKYVLDMIMGTICKENNVRITPGAEFNLNIKEVRGRREVIITPLD